MVALKVVVFAVLVIGATASGTYKNVFDYRVSEQLIFVKISNATLQLTKVVLELNIQHASMHKSDFSKLFSCIFWVCTTGSCILSV